jgi:hypothetical protein
MIPKSLHTVTALVNVARILRAPGESAASAVDRAAIVLGYGAGSVDQYGLLAKATATLGKGMQS